MELKKSFYRFLVNATFVNLYENKNIKNYIMLIHTSVKMDHDLYRVLIQLFV